MSEVLDLIAKIEPIVFELDSDRLSLFCPWPGQLKFFAAGADTRNRLLMAANQVGKTTIGAFEVACHLTGEYPDWWPGQRYHRPTRWWCASDTYPNTRDNCQQKLMGPPEDENAWGTGMIPRRCILDYSRAQHTPGMLDHVVVLHETGGRSVVRFKSYDQGRTRFQGEVLDGAWMDEEPPLDVFTEILTRTNTKPDGRTLMTATPLKGMTEVIMAFLDHEKAEQAVA